MPDPTVACVMLTRDRPEMAERAVRSFRAQTYVRKRLLIYDTGETDVPSEWGDVAYEQPGGRTIGALRNAANGHSEEDVIIHWDDDDWSHPNRIAEQVALLQASGVDAVGYREMLFWRHGTLLDQRNQDAREISEAWLYSSGNTRYCLGTSLCYWRRTWEGHPFPDLMTGEDEAWRKGLHTVGEWSCIGYTDGPRMIATIHGGNTNKAYLAEALKAPEFRRMPLWDSRVREILEKA